MKKDHFSRREFLQTSTGVAGGSLAASVIPLHQPLFAGRLTRGMLGQFLQALGEIGYNGSLAFEFSAQLAGPAAALREGRRELQSLMGA